MNKTILLTTAFPLMIIGCGGNSTDHNLGHIPVKWDNTTIEYYMDASILEHTMIVNNVCDILDTIEVRVPALTFIEVDAPGVDVVTFKYVKGVNSSYIGKVPNSEVIISSGRRSIAQHEIHHMLGMVHEHQLPFRDDHVNIDMNTVPDHILKDFKAHSDSMYLYDVYSYDYDVKSIMHYSSGTHGVTIKTLAGKAITYNDEATDMDYMKLNDVYPF